MNAVTQQVNEEKTKLQASIEAVKNFRSKCGAKLSINKSGGMYLAHPTFITTSYKTSDEGKTYSAGLNIDVEVARALCNNPLIIQEMKAFLKNVPSTLGLTKEEKEQFTNCYKKEKKEKQA